MTSQEIKTRILDIFNRIRQSPNSPFDESHLMDYLINPPSGKGRIRSSFKGSRKYYSFLAAIEMEFGICFRNSEHDREYSLDALVAKTQERIGNDKGNKMIIQERLKEESYRIEIILTILLILLILVFKFSIFSIIAAFLYVFAITWTLRRRHSYKKHNKDLYAKIIGSD